MKTSPYFLRVLTAGGSISPGDLRKVTALAQDYGLTTLEIGNRQELILAAERKVQREDMARRIHALGMTTDEPDALAQNIVSSLPATDVFPDTPWLTAGVYLDVLAQFAELGRNEQPPRLKINLIDRAQPLVPPATGNVNFVAAPEPDYWYVLLRPSGLVKRYVWPVLIASESIGAFARVVEAQYLAGKADNADTFYKSVMAEFVGQTRKPGVELNLPTAGIPVYEGFHRMQSGNFWLGLYRKNQAFPLPFIEALCDLCRQTRVGKLYLTTHKTLLIKDIREADRPAWDQLLGRFGIRTNVPAWHLNWQLPNADATSLALKNYILHQLEEADVRTDELSFAINVPFSEAAASVVIQRNGSPEHFDVYQRTHQTTTNAQYVVVAKSHPMAQLSDVVQQLALAYYERQNTPSPGSMPDEAPVLEKSKRLVHSCPACLSQYDARYGEPHRNIMANTSFAALPVDYTCGICEAERATFVEIWLE